MKIFNWVNRRFNNKEPTCDGAAQNAKKNGDIADDDKQFLVENKCNVFERWRGGILTIGTFGYDPLKDENEQINDVSNYLYEEEDEELEKEQVLSAEYGSDDDDEIITDSGEEVESDDDDDEAEEERPNLVCAGWDCEGLMELKMEDINSNRRREEFGFEYVMMEKKERTTLADLFYADSEDRELMMMKKQPIKKGEIIKHKSHGLFFGKKLIVHDSRPIRKLHQLMRRMLKRKIHPDLSPLNSKVSVVNKCETNDYASLLPTQDAII